MTDGEKIALWKGISIGGILAFVFAVTIFSLGFYYKVSQL